MNIKRGLFRLWLALSFLWVLAVGALGYDQISSDPYYQPPLEASGWKFIPIVPVFCSDVRGVAGKDYTTKQDKSPGPWDAYAKPNPFDNCWYELPVLRKLWPEYADMSDSALSDMLYDKTGHHLPDPLDSTKRFALVAFLPPAVVFFFGLLMVWVVSGFARSKQPTAP